MKIGFSTTCTFPVTLEASFVMGREAGYDGIEIMISGNKQTRDANYLKHLSEKYKLPILSFHAPTLLLTHFVWGNDPGVKLEKTAELAAETGANTVVVHPPYVWQKEYKGKFLDLVAEVERNTGVVIAVENMFPWKVKNTSIAAYSPSWEEIVEKTPHLTYDFSHAALSGWNSLEHIKELKDQISHIHLCDGFGNVTDEDKGKIFDEHLMPGMGNQRVAECLQYLKSVGWDGHVVAEINTKTARNNIERFHMVKHVSDWTRNVLEKPV